MNVTGGMATLRVTYEQTETVPHATPISRLAEVRQSLFMLVHPDYTATSNGRGTWSETDVKQT
jgi:hypothetical protein